MDFRISRYNFPISRDQVCDHTTMVNSSPCKYHVSNLGLECIHFLNVHNFEVYEVVEVFKFVRLLEFLWPAPIELVCGYPH